MTGGAGAGTILNVAQSKSFAAWPPVTIGASPTLVQFLPTMTPTGTISTLPVSTPTAAPTGNVGPGSGWNQAQDSAGWLVPVNGCDYPPAWSAINVAIPTAVCTGA